MFVVVSLTRWGPSWSWSYGNWIDNYLCNQCLSPLKLWVRTQHMGDVLDTTLCDKVCQWLATGRWFSTGTLVSSTNKTDRHVITEILLKVALNTINQPNSNVAVNTVDIKTMIDTLLTRVVDSRPQRSLLGETKMSTLKDDPSLVNWIYFSFDRCVVLSFFNLRFLITSLVSSSCSYIITRRILQCRYITIEI